MNPFCDPRISRRGFLTALAAAAASLLLTRREGRAEEGFRPPDATRAALAESPLIYVSPLRTDGAESTCHGEVWFVLDGADLLVCTGTDRWKARAVRRGLEGARIWVGDFGQWKRADGRFRTGPSFLAKARFESDSSKTERALGAFGAKYSQEWDRWESRFREGLADGSRVLIRYQPSGA